MKASGNAHSSREYMHSGIHLSAQMQLVATQSTDGHIKRMQTPAWEAEHNSHLSAPARSAVMLNQQTWYHLRSIVGMHQQSTVSPESI